MCLFQGSIPADLLRSSRDCTDVDAVVKALIDAPEDMQRPVVSVGARAIIARPPSRAMALIEDESHDS